MPAACTTPPTINRHYASKGCTRTEMKLAQSVSSCKAATAAIAGCDVSRQQREAGERGAKSGERERPRVWEGPQRPRLCPRTVTHAAKATHPSCQAGPRKTQQNCPTHTYTHKHVTSLRYTFTIIKLEVVLKLSWNAKRMSNTAQHKLWHSSQGHGYC